jgi:hypothetical protein
MTSNSVTGRQRTDFSLNLIGIDITISWGGGAIPANGRLGVDQGNDRIQRISGA